VKIDPGSHIPIYLQIADGLRAAVAAGVYRPGEALPSLRALAIDAQVNPNTVQRAYDQLEREGLVYSQRGRGQFVAEQGRSSAQTHAHQIVRQAFDQAVRAARAAGISDRQLREIFERAVHHQTPAGVERHDHSR
jgi:GntR family transcriptional regulator